MPETEPPIDDASAANEFPPPKRSRGGRPKNAPGTVRATTIGVRVSPAELDALQAKAEQMNMTPAHWLREAALSRRLPTPPVPAINRAHYAELARLSGNINQLAKLANTGHPVTVDSAFLQRLGVEVAQLRLALIGVASEKKS